MKFSEKCAVCKCNDVIEDRIHLFVECKSLKDIWDFIDNIFSVLKFEPLNVYEKILRSHEDNMDFLDFLGLENTVWCFSKCQLPTNVLTITENC